MRSKRVCSHTVPCLATARRAFTQGIWQWHNAHSIDRMNDLSHLQRR